MTILLDSVVIQSLILDRASIDQGAMQVTGSLSTGVQPLQGGSTYQFQLSLVMNKSWVNLTGATVTLSVQDPYGNVTTYPAMIVGGSAVTADITLANVSGTWTRVWFATINGQPYRSVPLAFGVESWP